MDASAIRLTATAALNVPLGFIQLPFILASPERSEWVPDGMWVREWRSVSWPLFGMFFWWLAGRGLEGLSAAVYVFARPENREAQARYLLSPRLRSIELLLGAALAAIGAVTCYILGWGEGLLSISTDYVMAAGAGLWAMLGLVTVTAGILQWRIMRNARRARAVAATN